MGFEWDFGIEYEGFQVDVVLNQSKKDFVGERSKVVVVCDDDFSDEVGQVYGSQCVGILNGVVVNQVQGFFCFQIVVFKVFNFSYVI